MVLVSQDYLTTGYPEENVLENVNNESKILKIIASRFLLEAIFLIFSMLEIYIKQMKLMKLKLKHFGGGFGCIISNQIT